MKKTTMNKVVAALVVGGLITTPLSVINTYAKTTNTKSKTNMVQKSDIKRPAMGAPLQFSDSMVKTELDALVKANTITQSQEDAVVSAFKTIDTQRKTEMDKVKSMTEAERKAYFESQTKTQPQDPLSSLMTAGTITQKQADAIKSAIGHEHRGFGMMDNHEQKSPVDMSKKMKTQLDALVKAGTITQSKEDAIISSLTALETQRKAEFDKVKSMTEAERKTYFDSLSKTAPQDPLSALVSAGTLTQTDADAVKAAFGNHMNEPRGGMMDTHEQMGFKDMSTNLKTRLDSLVTGGTISQNQEEAIISSFTALDTQRKAEMDKIKNMTEAERKAYFESQSKTAPKDPLASLVSAGTITQAQADAIKSSTGGHRHR